MNHETNRPAGEAGRRGFLKTASGASAALMPGGKRNAALNNTAGERRRLGSLEVSSIGLGVQNMNRTYQATIPHRPEMINIIRLPEAVFAFPGVDAPPKK